IQRCQLDQKSLVDRTSAGKEHPESKTLVEPRIAALASEFNKDVERALRRMGAAVRRSRVRLTPEAEEATLPAAARAVLDRFAVADALALYYRDRTQLTFLGLLIAAFLAMVVFELF